MKNEEILKSYIITNFKSIRQFALQTGLKYPTVVSVLNRGLNNSCTDTVFEICNALDISAESLFCDGIIAEKSVDDKQNHIYKLENYYLNFKSLSKETFTLDDEKMSKEETEMFEDGMEQLMEMIRKKRKRKKTE